MIRTHRIEAELQSPLVFYIQENTAIKTFGPLGYERVYLPLKVADKPFHIQGDEISATHSPANTRRSPNVGLLPMMSQHWVNVSCLLRDAEP